MSINIRVLPLAVMTHSNHWNRHYSHSLFAVLDFVWAQCTDTEHCVFSVHVLSNLLLFSSLSPLVLFPDFSRIQCASTCLWKTLILSFIFFIRVIAPSVGQQFMVGECSRIWHLACLVFFSSSCLLIYICVVVIVVYWYMATIVVIIFFFSWSYCWCWWPRSSHSTPFNGPRDVELNKKW